MYAKLPVQRLSVVADDIETAASYWTLWSEGADDDMASRLHRAGDLAGIGETVASGNQEVKDSTVVPHIVSRGLQVDFGDVGDKPVDTHRGFPYSGSVRINGGLRDIEDGDVLISTDKKVIDQ
jgi:hypothetical protein